MALEWFCANQHLLKASPQKQSSKQEQELWIENRQNEFTFLDTLTLIAHSRTAAVSVCSSLALLCLPVLPPFQSSLILYTNARAHHYCFSLMVLSNGSIYILYSERIESNEWMNKYNQLLISFSKQNKPVLCTALSFSSVLYVCTKAPSLTTLGLLLAVCRLDVCNNSWSFDCRLEKPPFLIVLFVCLFVCLSFCSLQYYHSSLCACVRAIAKEVLDTHTRSVDLRLCCSFLNPKQCCHSRVSHFLRFHSNESKERVLDRKNPNVRKAET